MKSQGVNPEMIEPVQRCLVVIQGMWSRAIMAPVLTGSALFPLQADDDSTLRVFVFVDQSNRLGSDAKVKDLGRSKWECKIREILVGIGGTSHTATAAAIRGDVYNGVCLATSSDSTA